MADDLTLVEFLTARLDEDEAWANQGVGLSRRLDAGAPDGVARVLRVVEAKRAIVEWAADLDAKCPEDDWPDEGGMELAPLSDAGRWLMRHLATAYADHEDYDVGWRP